MHEDPKMRAADQGERELERPAARPSGAAPAPMMEREVPIAATSPFEAMHRWLDGEATEGATTDDPEAARYVALWKSVGRETARRSTVHAPPDLTARVMAALPGASTSGQPARVLEMPRAAQAAPVRAVAPAMAAAPAAAPSAASAATTWWQRPVELNQATALAAAAGLVALGLALGASLKGQ